MNMSFSPQLAAMESQNLQLQEEIAKLGAKISAFEKEKADLAKKLEDARIHSKRQNEVKLSSGFYSYSFDGIDSDFTVTKFYKTVREK